MISPNEKFKVETISYVTRQLLIMLEATRNGDMRLANQLGFDAKMTAELEVLPANQFESVVERYIERCTMSFHLFDPATIKLALNNTSEQEMIDQFIRHGACNRSLSEIFGLRADAVAARREILQVKASRGRSKSPDHKVEQTVFDMWLGFKADSAMTFKSSILQIAKLTKIDITHIYRFVERCERITEYNPSMTRPEALELRHY